MLYFPSFSHPGPDPAAIAEIAVGSAMITSIAVSARSSAGRMSDCGVQWRVERLRFALCMRLQSHATAEGTVHI